MFKRETVINGKRKKDIGGEWEFSTVPNKAQQRKHHHTGKITNNKLIFIERTNKF